jgi:hypothetical protein
VSFPDVRLLQHVHRVVRAITALLQAKQSARAVLLEVFVQEVLPLQRAT